MMETRVSLDRAPSARDSKIVVATSQDVEDIIERNKALRSIPQRSDWGRHVASIPLNIINAWLHEEWSRGNVNLRMAGPEFDAMVKRKLADPDWRHLRTDK